MALVKPAGNYWLLQALIARAGLLAGAAAARAAATAAIWFDVALAANLTVLIAVAPGWPRADITPYYFATNAPRQEAGVARTSIVKFVRKN